MSLLGGVLALVVGSVVGLLVVPLLPETAQSRIATWQGDVAALRGEAVKLFTPAEGATVEVNTQTHSPLTSPTDAVPGHDVGLVAQLERLVHTLVNNQRQQREIPLLREDNRLSAIARAHSQDMSQNDYFAHQNLSGQDPSRRAAMEGYTCRKNYGSYYTEGIAENIFQNWLISSTTYIWPVPIPIKDRSSPEELAISTVSGWMESSGHRENILDPNYDRVGTGIAISKGEKVYITQNFC